MTSKYDRLANHLATLSGEEIVLTFAEVEAVVGPLPQSARRAPRWRGVRGKAYAEYAHTMHWRRAGFVAERPDFAAETVTFRRVLPCVCQALKRRSYA